MKYLDVLVINNYDNQMKLQETVKAIAELLPTNPTYEEKTVSYVKERSDSNYKGGKRTKQNQDCTAEVVLYTSVQPNGGAQMVNLACVATMPSDK